MNAYAQITVTGVVQGVGFRPFVWQLAKQFGHNGWVLNNASGVEILLKINRENNPEAEKQFVEALRGQAPALAQVDRVLWEWIDPNAAHSELAELKACSDFTIQKSRSGLMQTAVLSDAATCSACLRDVFDPENRRYGYPFTNCTHCGPRYSIIRSMPYDREYTSMAGFNMCPVCQREYQNPSDRRFHAQPNACPACGPQLRLTQFHPSSETSHTQENGLSQPDNWRMIEQVCHYLAKGLILAIKGLGGFHLVCDAGNDSACRTLRQRKSRPQKPFALMASDMDVVKRYAKVSKAAEERLTSTQAPIVLLPKLGKLPPSELSELVAPNQSRLGIMLPNTPLHSMLMSTWAKTCPDRLLVFTSANLSGHPQIYRDDKEAELIQLADAVLTHNRPIIRRLEDSVMKTSVEGNDCEALRQSRGFAPLRFTMPEGFPSLNTLASGGDLKNSIAFQKGNEITLLHFLGDMENFDIQTAYGEALQDLQQLYQLKPEHIITDKHPGYYVKEEILRYREKHAPAATLTEIQHHHAHLNACLFENAIPLGSPPVLGIILDGLGFGEDGTFWGGEILYGTYDHFIRLGNLAPRPLLGGDKANKEPWRNLYALVRTQDSLGNLIQRYPQVQSLRQLQAKPTGLLDSMSKSGLNSPLSSSTGRLFDAVAAVCDLCFDGMSYEGEAAMQLESLLSEKLLRQEWENAYVLQVETDPQSGRQLLDTASLLSQILKDLNQHLSASQVSARFHLGLVKALLKSALLLRNTHPFELIALSGGVCQNGWLIWIFRQMTPPEITLLTHRRLPANDQSIAVGQLCALAAQQSKSVLG